MRAFPLTSFQSKAEGRLSKHRKIRKITNSHSCGLCPFLIGCLHAAFLLAVSYLSCFPASAQCGFCFSFSGIRTYCNWWRKSCPLETYCAFSFAYGVLRALLYICPKLIIMFSFFRIVVKKFHAKYIIKAAGVTIHPYYKQSDSSWFSLT